MLALLAPGVGMGGGDGEVVVEATVGGHAFGRRASNFGPHLAALLLLLLGVTLV